MILLGLDSGLAWRGGISRNQPHHVWRAILQALQKPVRRVNKEEYTPKCVKTAYKATQFATRLPYSSYALKAKFGG
jgi:hypothetical protein